MRASGVEKKGSCHIFRHTMATLMLEGGADIRYVQAMLGHARFDTTAVYTRVSIAKLQQVHAMAHAGALLKPPGGTGMKAPDEDAPAREDVISLLAAEGENEPGELDEGEREEDERGKPSR